VLGRPSYVAGPAYTVPRRRRAHGNDDPYVALGTRSGGLQFYPAVELIGGRDSNPSQGPGGTAANFYSVAPELRVQSDWLRHDFNADLRGNYRAFRPDTTPTLSRPYFNGMANGRIDVTRNDRVNLGARTLVSTDNPGSPNVGAGLSKLPIFTTFGGNAGVAHRFNRLEIAVKGDAERTVFENSKLTDGTTVSNKSRNFNQYAGTVRVGYDYFPGVMPFVEATADVRKHDLIPDAFGFNRNSKGLTGTVGTTFELTRFLTGEIAIGYTRRTYDDARLTSLKGLVGNASLIWNASALTTVRLTGASRVGESNIADVSGILYRDAGLQIDHAFRQWLIGTAILGFGFDTYPGGLMAVTPDRQDKRYSAGLRLTYKLNRMMQLKGEVRRDWLRSNVGDADYTANIFLIGLRLQY
jgi:hypothetical protein